MNSKSPYKEQVSFLFNLIHSTYRYSQKAYQAVNVKEVTDYQTSLAFAVQANTFATGAFVYYHQNKQLSCPQYDSFFEYFQNFNFEILQTITKKDTNIALLNFKNKELLNSFFDVEKLIESVLAEPSYQLID